MGSIRSARGHVLAGETFGAGAASVAFRPLDPAGLGLPPLPFALALDGARNVLAGLVSPRSTPTDFCSPFEPPHCATDAAGRVLFAGSGKTLMARSRSRSRGCATETRL